MEFQTIVKLLQGYFAIPDYQRDYEWTSAQITTLIDDVMAIVSQETQNHFIGAIVTVPYEKDCAVSKSINFDTYKISESAVKHVVDGQQRLISCTVLISCIIDCIDEEKKITKGEKEVLKKVISPILTGDDTDEDLNLAPKLILNGNTGNCYNNYIIGISDESYDQRFKGAKHLLDAYNIFENEIYRRRDDFLESGVFKDRVSFYKALVKAVSEKLKFVEIACDKSADAFQVFDSLNGKGLDLTAADRIKNILLSWTPKNKEGLKKWDTLEREIGEKYLSSFFVAIFFLHKGKRVSQGKLPDEFKSKFKDKASENVQKFWDNLLKSAKLYGNLRKSCVKNVEVKNRLNDIQCLGQEQIYALLFAVLEHFGEAQIEKNDFISFLDATISLLVRMQVCEKSMNRLDSYFTKWIAAMKSGKKIKSIKDLTKQIQAEKEQIVDTKTFKAMFAIFAPSNSKTSCFYLRHIETLLRQKKKMRGLLHPENITVEHIFPQNADPQIWFGKDKVPFEFISDPKNFIEHIGNKALLYGDDNTSAGNNTYKKKVGVYKKGKQKQVKGTPEKTFCMISELLNDCPTEFTYKSITERAKKLASYAIEIW